MNMKYFCGIAAAATVLLCGVGCGDKKSSDIYGNSDMIYLNKNQNAGQSPAAAKWGYRAGTRHETVVTAGTDENGETVNNDYGYNGPGVAERGGSDWFTAHTLFRMEMNDDDNWYKVTSYDEDTDYTYTSSVIMFEPIPNTGLRDEQKMPDTLLTKKPASGGGSSDNGTNVTTVSGKTKATKASAAN